MKNPRVFRIMIVVFTVLLWAAMITFAVLAFRMHLDEVAEQVLIRGAYDHRTVVNWVRHETMAAFYTISAILVAPTLLLTIWGLVRLWLGYEDLI